MFIYDTEKDKLAAQIDYIDPIQGKIAGVAEEELSFKTLYDPASYTKGTGAVNVDTSNYWSKNYVGRLWWDLSTVKYHNPYQGSIIYQTANWNKLFKGSSIDVYEWVETELLPSQWLEQADTEEGLANGISGTPKYDDKTLVTTRVYNKDAQSFSNKFYYWVKNRKFIPTGIEFRKTSAFDVAQLIEDPQAQGYKFTALLADN